MKPVGKKWVVGSFAALAVTIASALASHYEGVRYTAYRDVGGVWTICYGHTRGVKEGDTATPEQCMAWLAQDMPTAYAAVDRCISAEVTVSQAAAFTDAAYNEGPKVVCGSTLQRLANSGHVVEACHQLPRWAWAGGEKQKGLERRRGDETDLCTEGLQ